MNKLLRNAPIDEKNICGSAIIDFLNDEYETTMTKEYGKTTYTAIYVGLYIVQVSWHFGSNVINVWGDRPIATNDVALKLKYLLRKECDVKCVQDGTTIKLITYWEDEDVDTTTEETERKVFENMKEKHKDCLLLFRVGDCYESYNEDALILRDVLNIKMIVSYNKETLKDWDTCTFKHMELDEYLPRLIRAGHRVIICDLEK